MENAEGDHEQVRSVVWFNVGLCPDGNGEGDHEQVRSVVWFKAWVVS